MSGKSDCKVYVGKFHLNSLSLQKPYWILLILLCLGLLESFKNFDFLVLENQIANIELGM